MLVVLRLGHRPSRDKRVTTHVALTARALGADEVWVSTKDGMLERTINDLVTRFGGGFIVRTGVKWRDAIKSWKGSVVHLTMYGQHLQEALRELERMNEQDMLIIVGAEKVPREVYELAHLNVSIGNQPHSEIAALAVFLYAALGDAPLYRKLNSRLTVIPNPRGKTVVDEGRSGSDDYSRP